MAGRRDPDRAAQLRSRIERDQDLIRDFLRIVAERQVPPSRHPLYTESPRHKPPADTGRFDYGFIERDDIALDGWTLTSTSTPWGADEKGIFDQRAFVHREAYVVGSKPRRAPRYYLLVGTDGKLYDTSRQTVPARAKRFFSKSHEVFVPAPLTLPFSFHGNKYGISANGYMQGGSIDQLLKAIVVRLLMK